MNKLTIINKMPSIVHKSMFQLKKHSPEILIVGGVIGTVTSAVMACKATTKLSDILEESKETIDKIHEVASDEAYADRYSEEDAKKDMTITYVQTGLKIAKLYAPSVILGALSIGCMVASNNILRKRNIALAAAYATVDKSFKEYRGRVVERFGEAVDRELKYNIKAKKIEEMEIDPETGKEKKVKKTIEVADIGEHSMYARFFDESCEGWERNAEFNLMFLRQRQQYANDLLRARGYLFLNEVYRMLGLPETKAGQVVGWVYNEQNPVGDNYVDFGIYNINKEKNRDFVNGYEYSILLDFNVDGDILDLMP